MLYLLLIGLTFLGTFLVYNYIFMFIYAHIYIAYQIALFLLIFQTWRVLVVELSFQDQRESNIRELDIAPQCSIQLKNETFKNLKFNSTLQDKIKAQMPGKYQFKGNVGEGKDCLTVKIYEISYLLHLIIRRQYFIGLLYTFLYQTQIETGKCMKEGLGPNKYSLDLSQEDQLIRNIVESNQNIKWSKVLLQIRQINPQFSRSSKQIRQRWKFHLDPHLNNDAWTPEQQEIVFKSHMLKGSKWKEMQKLLPGRSQKSIKNFFYMCLRKSLRRVTKILGVRNSTNQSRQIKPHVLNKLVESANEKPWQRESMYRLFQLHKVKSGECKKVQMQGEDIQIYRQLIDDIIRFNDLYSINKKHALTVLDQKLINLKSSTSGNQKETQKSLIQGSSTVPSVQDDDDFELDRQFDQDQISIYKQVQELPSILEKPVEEEVIQFSLGDIENPSEQSLFYT